MEGKIIEGEIDAPKVARIGSDNFMQYASDTRYIDGQFLRGDLEDFDKQIELPEEVHQSIKAMYELKREGKAIGPTTEDRNIALATQIDKVKEGWGQLFVEQLPESTTVEQARMIYLGVDDGKVKSTESAFGYGGEVSMMEPIGEAVAKNGLPIIGIHTHPKGSLFSMDDYSMLLMGEPVDKMRFLKTNIVLCPDMQIMAVVTKDTPMFIDGREVDKFIDSRRNDLNEQETSLLTKSLEKLKVINDRQKVVAMVGAVKEKLSSVSEAVVKQISDQFDVQENEEEQLNQMMEETLRYGPNESSRMVNSALVSFAKELNVKLYFSQDMRTFKEFSA